MAFTGPLINAAVVLLAGIFGSFFKKGIPQRITDTVTQGVGMCVLVIGIRGAIRPILENAAVNENIEIIAVISMALGILLGELINIDRHMNRFGAWMEARINALLLRRKQGHADGGEGTRAHVAEGFVNATMLFCVGAWAITGAVSSALGDHSSLIAKSVVDGIMALVLASSLGMGVALSALSLLVYQGGFTLLALFIGSFLDPAATAAMGIVGSILVMMVATNLMGITKIRVANCIPAMFLPILAVWMLA